MGINSHEGGKANVSVNEKIGDTRLKLVSYGKIISARECMLAGIARITMNLIVFAVRFCLMTS